MAKITVKDIKYILIVLNNFIFIFSLNFKSASSPSEIQSIPKKFISYVSF
jgi:hypothetical protein